MPEHLPEGTSAADPGDTHGPVWPLLTLSLACAGQVNIVPIIAKSDTMTTKEKEEFKLQVREALQREGIEAFTFDQAVLRSMEQQDRQEYKLPWAVIGSTDAHLDAGATVFLRKYPWGDALSSEPAHSDLPALRNLLMWSGQWHDLKMASRAKYEAWRATRPLSKRSRSALLAIGTAGVAKLQRLAGGAYRAVHCVRRAGHVACESVGLPPRFASRALAVLVVALVATATPPAVRWATGTDVTAARQLAMARREVSDDCSLYACSHAGPRQPLPPTMSAARLPRRAAWPRPWWRALPDGGEMCCAVCERGLCVRLIHSLLVCARARCARSQVEQLVDDKARLVGSYEKMLADLRGSLNAARSSGDHLGAEQKAWAVERYDLQRALRAATTRADVAEAKASAASDSCSVQTLVEKCARRARPRTPAPRCTPHRPPPHVLSMPTNIAPRQHRIAARLRSVVIALLVIPVAPPPRTQVGASDQREGRRLGQGCGGARE